MGKGWIRRSMRGIAVMLAAAGITLSTGCEPDVGRQFRDAALPSLHTGVSAIVNGLVEGVFATIEPEPANTP